MAVDARISEVLKKISEKGTQEVSEVIGTITNKSVTISSERIEEFDFSGLQSNYSESVLMISGKLNTDPEGIFMVFLEKLLSIKISSWMVMTEPAEEFTDEHLDSMSEIANQVIGALVPVIREELQTNVEFQNIEAKVYDVTEDLFGYPDLISAHYNLEIEGEDPVTIYLVITASTVESLIPEEKADEDKTEEEEIDAPAEEDIEIPTEEGEEAIGEEEEGIEGVPEGEEPTGEEGEGEEGETDAVQEGSEEEAEQDMGDFDLEGMLSEAQEAVDQGDEYGAVEEIEEKLEKKQEAEEVPPKLEMLMDLSFPVSIELGRTKMLIKDILELGHGSVIEFDKLAGEPVDLLVNDKKVAEGEVVVIDEHFGIRITNLLEPSERITKLK